MRLLAYAKPWCAWLALISVSIGVLAQTDRRPPSAAERQQRPGPWDQDILIYRVATNGVAERAGMFERAGVATVTRLRDGRLLAAHQHFPENNEMDFDKVAVHFSSDEGISWSTARVIQISGLPEGMRFPFDPTLVPLPDGRIRLYFTSLRGLRFEQDTPAIYSAISTNGVDYLFEPGMRFGIEGRPVIDCAVAVHNETFHLYSPDNGAGRMPGGPDRGGPPGARPRVGAAYHAVSDDGIHFKRVEDVTVEGRRQWLGNAQSDGKLITFFGSGEGGMWSATSADGIAWSALKTIRDLPIADPGAVMLKDGSWLLLGTGPPRPNTPSRRPMPDRREN